MHSAQAEGVTEQYAQNIVLYADAAAAERGHVMPTQGDVENAIAELNAGGDLKVSERGTDKSPGAALSWSNGGSTCTARVGVDTEGTGRLTATQDISCTP